MSHSWLSLLLGRVVLAGVVGEVLLDFSEKSDVDCADEHDENDPCPTLMAAAPVQHSDPTESRESMVVEVKVGDTASWKRGDEPPSCTRGYEKLLLAGCFFARMRGMSPVWPFMVTGARSRLMNIHCRRARD